jgi:hypothetical protein
MKARLFVSTAAAALLAAATFASAQTGGGGGQGSGAGGAGASQSGGASGGMGAGGSSSGGAGSSTMDRGSGGTERGSTTTQDRVQDEKAAPNQRTGQSPSRSDRNQAQNPRSDQRDAQSPGHREGAGQTGQNGQRGSQGARENTGAAPSNVTSEQRTQIRQRLGSNTSARIDRANVNFSLSVGVRVPTSVRLYDLPPAIVEIVPAYRGYKYVIVEEEIVIIDPRSHTIVTVIES